MRVVDLDRDMRDVIPTGTTRDSDFLFARMTEVTLDLSEPAPGRRILDVASGFGQDAVALVERGAWVVGAEPSLRMSAWARLNSADGAARRPQWVRAWSDGLPFASRSFDAVICKGAIDHFDRPEAALGEMARVTRADGRVVVAIANFESLACRLSRWGDALAARRGVAPARGRRHYDVPADHFTRYDLGLMREQMERVVQLDVVRGISLVWGLPRWGRWLERMPVGVARAALQGLDAVAARAPALADVVVLAGRPRRRERRARTSR